MVTPTVKVSLFVIERTVVSKFSTKKPKNATTKRRYTRKTATGAVQHVSNKTTNLAHGKAFTMSEQFELVSLLATSFVEDKFYETANTQVERLKGLIASDPKFAAKAAIYIRTQFGMRSITHVVGGEIAKNVKGESWTRSAIDKMVYRLDDATEIAAYYLKNYGKPIPNSLKKGLAAALGRYDEYAFAKYRGEGNEISMVDLVNLIHPKPTERNAEALRKLMKGELKNTGTWESKLSEAGGDEELKGAVWKDLLEAKQLGYFALLKNLRNICEQADSATLKIALKQLVDEKAIKKSLVLPFRFTNAYDQIKAMTHPDAGKILQALSGACDISVSNCPTFRGKLAVVVDDSGSMTSALGKPVSPAQHAALFAAILLRANPDADFICFNDSARYVTVDPSMSVLALRDQISTKFVSGGTNFNSIFPAFKRKYDRVVILSDMQGWVGHATPEATVTQYAQKYGGKRPKIYSFDLNGYGSLQFAAQDVYAVAGFSDKVFTLLNMLEGDPQAMVNEILQIEL